MHLNITTVPPRKACLSPAWLAVSGVWGMVPMFLGLGVLVCSVLALVFLSPEGQGNLPHPPSPIGVQRPCHSCIPFKARSAFFLRNTEIKAGLRIGTCFLLVWGSGFPLPLQWRMSSAHVLSAGSKTEWQGVGQWPLVPELPQQQVLGMFAGPSF